MAQQWYWMQGGQKRGPVEDAGLRQLAAKGQLKPTDMIWREGLPNWVPAGNVKGLFPPQTQTPATTVPPAAAARAAKPVAIPPPPPPPRPATPPQAAPPPPPAPVAARLVEPGTPPQATPPPPPPQAAPSAQAPASAARTSPSAMPRQNLYKVLNLPQTASVDELKKAINKELRLWSNRTNAPQIERRQEAERMVKLLEQAEAILLDPAQRAAYDRQLALAPAEQREVQEGDLSGGVDLVQEARRLLGAGNVADALYVAERATQRDGNNAEAWAVLGEARFRWGDTEDAIYEYKRAIKLRPNEATYYFEFGSVLESADRPAEALQQYQRAAQIDSGTTMYRAAIGSLLIKKEQYADGMHILEQCVREQPDNPTYHWFLAIAYSESAILGWTHIGEGHPLLTEGWYATEFQHITDAQECLNKAMSLKFDDPDLMAQLQQRRRRIDEMLQRKLMCNWAVAVIVGVIGIPMFFIPTILAILYVISSSTPQYRINKRLVQGKHFNEFAFIAESLGSGNVGCVGVVFMYVFIILAMPFVVAINFYRNWLSVPSVKNLPTRSGGGVVRNAPVARPA